MMQMALICGGLTSLPALPNFWADTLKCVAWRLAGLQVHGGNATAASNKKPAAALSTGISFLLFAKVAFPPCVVVFFFFFSPPPRFGTTTLLVSACLTTFFYASLSIAISLHFWVFMFPRSALISSSHLNLGLPNFRTAVGFRSVIIFSALYLYIHKICPDHLILGAFVYLTISACLISKSVSSLVLVLRLQSWFCIHRACTFYPANLQATRCQCVRTVYIHVKSLKLLQVYAKYFRTDLTMFWIGLISFTWMSSPTWQFYSKPFNLRYVLFQKRSQ